MQYGTAGNLWYKDGEAIGKAFASTIPWTKQVQRQFANLPPVITFAIKTRRNNSTLVNNTNFEYYQP